MPDDSRPHRRHPHRLFGYDYSQPGAYFLTLCAQNRESRFGSISEDVLSLNDAGRMVESWCSALGAHIPNAAVDSLVIMPNHVHVVVSIGASRDTERSKNADAPSDQSLPSIVKWLKTRTTYSYIRGVKDRGWPAFDGRLWQRDYYEHIIRNEAELMAVRQYIQDNPIRWALDRENPAHSTRATATGN